MPQKEEKEKEPIDEKLQEAIDNKPIFKEYQIKQDEIQSKDPYLTNVKIYTSQSRKSFYKFISDTYTTNFKLIKQVKGKIDEDACAKLGAAAGKTVEAFLYQKFIREYIRNASPYRGLLVYHGLGSGKTCSAIAAAEALYGNSNKKIIIMTPFSLRGNFMSEISFCGFRHFNVNNYWVEESLVSEGGITYLYANSVLSLSDKYLREVLQRPDERKVIWIPDFTKPSNFDDLEQYEREDIRLQITNMLENRITFISYNGVTASQLKNYACLNPGERFFDNAVIVIDEIHNLTRLMQGSITPYITKRKGRSRKIPVEPIVPGKWKPGLCNSELNYQRAYLFYKLLTDARNSKIIGLSGTPIINFPDELGILANVLAGYMECVELNLNSTDKAIIDKFKTIAELEPRVDIVRFISRMERMEVLISVLNEGYEKAEGGVQYNPDAQDDIKTVFERIKIKLKEAKITFGSEKYVSYPRLPSDDKEFKDEFIDPVSLSIKNKVVLQKRLTGLISYYKGSKDEYMPRIIKDEVVRCEMSNYVLSMYTVERKKEIKGEKQKEEKGDQYSVVEKFAKMKNPSSYRFRSRAMCNFTFPKGIERPFPSTFEDMEEEVALEPQTVTEMTSDVQDIPELVEEVVHEDIPEPDVLEQEGGVDVEELAHNIETQEEEKQEGGMPPKRTRPKVAQTAEIVEQVEPVEVTAEVPELKEPSILEKIEDFIKPEEKESMLEKIQDIIGPEEKEEKVPISRALTYQESIKGAMERLDTNKDNYLKLDSSNQEGRVAQYSTKIDRMIRNILTSKGSNLVYSQFKTVEGLGVLGLVLKANGFVEIEIEGEANSMRFSDKTIASLKKDEKRFIFLTGEGLREKRNLILNIFNGQFDKLPEKIRTVLEAKYMNMNSLNKEQKEQKEKEGYIDRNIKGKLCNIIGITGAGAEGISLKCCRSVHIMEPYWNKVRSDQVKGRAIRICSHQDLPYEERDVEIYTYYTVFSADQKSMNKIDITIRQADKDETSDENVFNVGLKKDKINQELLDLMKETAVDCGLNSADNGVQCFEVIGRPNQYLFDPNLEVDKMLTNIEIKEVKVEKVEKTEKEEKEQQERPMQTAQVVKMRRGGVKEEFLIYPKKSGIIYNIYERTDDRLSKPIGELAINPATGNFKDVLPLFYV